MRIKNVSGEELSQALSEVNKKYDNNVIWNNYKQLSEKRFTITLRVASAKKGSKGRKLNQSALMGYGHGFTANGSACWHVHGHFFEALLEIQPKAIIETKLNRIYKDEYGNIQGNWTDTNIGSLMNPVSYSECCECNE